MYQIPPIPAERIVIVGGFGALGQLVALYYTESNNHNSIVLIGRQGHGAISQKVLQGENITMKHCDTSSTADICLLDSPSTAKQPQVEVHFAAGVVKVCHATFLYYY